MGQYYRFINLDKKEQPRDKLVSGSRKLTEHSYSLNEYCNDVLNLLSNEWSGDCILHVGDYAKAGDKTTTSDLFKKISLPTNYKSLDSYGETFKEVKPEKNRQIRYVYNLNKQEYIDLLHQPIQWVSLYQPQPNNFVLDCDRFNSFALLTACGNGQGGGDYHDSLVNVDKIGSWAGDHFVSSIEPIKLFEDFKENKLIFNEMLDIPKTIKEWNDVDLSAIYDIESAEVYNLFLREYEDMGITPDMIHLDSDVLTHEEFKLFTEKLNSINNSKSTEFENSDIEM